MLLKSKNMIRDYNSVHEKSIITNNELNKLISLNLDQKNDSFKKINSDEIVLEVDTNLKIKDKVLLTKEVTTEQEIQNTSEDSSSFSTQKSSTAIAKKQTVATNISNNLNVSYPSAAENTANQEVAEEKKLLENQIGEIENIIQSLNIN